MDSCPYLKESLCCVLQGHLHFYLTNYSTSGLRHGNRQSGADHIWAKINLNGKKGCKGVQISFLVFLLRCSCKCPNPVMSVAVCVKTTCFDAIQLYTILIWKLIRNTCKFLRSTLIESKCGLKRLLLNLLGPQNAVD